MRQCMGVVRTLIIVTFGWIIPIIAFAQSPYPSIMPKPNQVVGLYCYGHYDRDYWISKVFFYRIPTDDNYWMPAQIAFRDTVIRNYPLSNVDSPSAFPDCRTLATLAQANEQRVKFIGDMKAQGNRVVDENIDIPGSGLLRRDLIAQSETSATESKSSASQNMGFSDAVRLY